MIWTHEIDHYSQEDRQHISKLEQQLLHEYQELKSDIEDNELRYNLIFTRPFSSYLLPKDPQHLAKERRIFLERLSHVETSPNIQFLSDEIREELDSATNSDYTAESLSILLHEYYLKRLSSLTYAKTLHCVRWKRFCRYYTNFDHVQKQFKLRSNRILAEFNDALQRTQRLRSVRESLLSSSATAKQTQQLLIADDYISFVRQLVCQYRGSKYFDQFTQLIRLSHLKFRTKLSSEQTDIINLEPPSMQNLSFTFPSSVHTKSSNLTILNANKLPTIDIEQKQTLEKLKPLLKQYSIPYDIDKIKTMGDEMELYATIIRHFRTLFYKQEQEIPRFKYDSAPANIMNMSRQSSVYKLLKSSPWTKFIDIYPEKSPQVERDYCRYKIRSNTNAKNDELLKMISKFVRVHNADKATNVLKQYLIAVKTKQNGAIQRLVQNASGQSAIADIFWRNIFEVTKDQNNNNDDDNQTDEIEDDGNFHDDDAKSARYMKRDEFNYTETLQKLGLDDTGMHDDNEDDASESYGLQLSFITLRLLRIRELRTQCLHEYNYIRSLQRTMTIYEQHLTIIPENKKSSKSEELRSIDARFGSRKIPHTYLFDAPDQCTIDDLNFMESGEETENFEDFFHFDDNNDNCVHVQDPLGFHIIYDCAIDDVQQLEDEIISIGSYFIEKECVLHPPSSDGSSIDYTRKIDRFEVLCNLWELEQKYLYYKRQLLDCYYEVYQHTFDANERKCLSKIITDIVAMRPKIDFKNSSYFIQSYNIEIRILIVKLKILKEYINRHVRDMRLMCDNLIETESEDYGSYLSTGIKKPKPPSIFLSASKIRNYYLFEYIESLSSISRIPSILTQTINELLYFEQIQNRTQNTTIYQLLYELEYMDYLYTTYSTLEKPGHTFSQANQRDIFNSVYSENPQVVAQLATEILKQIDDTRTTKKEQYDKFTKLSTQLIDIINLRYRLVKSASECEILTMIYKQQTDVMNIDHSHLYMRYIQFEFAQQKNITITSATETSDGRLDKITQQNMLFAIQELEEGQIGRINFRNKEQWQSYINDGEDAVANLRAALKAQLIHNNCVHIAIYQHRLAIICITNQLSTMKMRANSAMTPVEENKTGRTHINTAAQSKTLLNSVLYENQRRKLFRDYFVSIQFEKTPCRDQILNDFLKQRELKPLQYQQPRESEKLKRSLIHEFVDRVHARISVISTRMQLLYVYNGLRQIIDEFPLTARTHFMWGKDPVVENPDEKITAKLASSPTVPETLQSQSTLAKPTSNGYTSRLEQLFNNDGTKLVNLWYIPTSSEILNMFRNLYPDVDQVRERLRDAVRIVSSLNDLIHVTVAYALLNNAAASSDQRLVDRSLDLSMFDQSGQFASELHEIQREMDLLIENGVTNDNYQQQQQLNTTLVADLLETKRSLTLFQFYFAGGYLIPKAFLTAKNNEAFECVRSNSQHILHYLVNDFSSTKPYYVLLPDPLIPAQPLSTKLFPWTTYEYKYNVNSKKLWPFYSLIGWLNVCLINLRPNELTTANAEITYAHVMFQETDEIMKHRYTEPIVLRKTMLKTGNIKHPLLNKYHLAELYIIAYIRLEILRRAWSTGKLNVSDITNVKSFEESAMSFRDEILSPILRQLATVVGEGSFYDNFENALYTGQLPTNVTEYDCKQALVARLLVEIEKHMINDTIKRFKRERTLVIAERNREEANLPSDLWKKQNYTEGFNISRPHILDEFGKLITQYALNDVFTNSISDTNNLNDVKMDSQSIVEESNMITFDDDQQSTNESVTVVSHKYDDTLLQIRKSDFELCLKQLGNRIMQREHDNYINYSSYYESLLYHARQLLQTRENEIDSLKLQLTKQHYDNEIESQLLTLQSYYELVAEIIKLRSAHDQLLLEQRKKIHETTLKIRENYMKVNKQLLNTNLILRQKFEKYREHLYNSVVKIISQVKIDMYEMARTKLGKDGQSIIEQQHNEQTKLTNSLQNELYETKQRSINEKKRIEDEWSTELSKTQKELQQTKYRFERYQKHYTRKTKQYCEELHTMKKINNYLRKKIMLNDNLYRQLKEKKSKLDNEHSVERHDELRQALNQKQLIETKLKYMEKVTEQLSLKDNELEKKTTEYEKENQVMKQTANYVKRDIVHLRKQLETERSLKFDAFQKVETLKTNLEDLEEELEQIIVNDEQIRAGGSSIVSGPAKFLSTSRPSTPWITIDREREPNWQQIMTKTRPVTSSSFSRNTNKQQRLVGRVCYSSTSRRPQTANVQNIIENITPLTEEILSNLGTQSATQSLQKVRIRSAKA